MKVNIFLILSFFINILVNIANLGFARMNLLEYLVKICSFSLNYLIISLIISLIVILLNPITLTKEEIRTGKFKSMKWNDVAKIKVYNYWILKYMILFPKNKDEIPLFVHLDIYNLNLFKRRLLELSGREDVFKNV